MDKELLDLTAPQKSIWLTEQYFKNTNVNNICGTAIVSELLNFDILKKAINNVIMSNDIFKIKFINDNGILKQYFDKYKLSEISIIDLNSKSEIFELEKQLSSKVFDIENNLYEFKIFRIKKENICGYMLNIHHIISDAITIGMISQKIMEIYISIKNNEPIKIIEDATYENYIKSEKEYILSPKYEKDKSYWKDIFSTLPNIITIPSSKHDIKNIFSCDSNRFSNIIHKDTMGKIKDYCSKNKISIFNLFMGILSIYLYKSNNLNDFVIGTPILNRTNYVEKQTLGMFINVAPIRINILENSTISELLSSIATNSMGLLRHQKYSYQSILEDLRKDYPNIPNLYNIVLSYQETKANIKSDIKFETHWAFNGNCTNDIDIHIFDINDTGELTIAYDYKTDKYDEKDINNINNRIMYILSQILDDNNLKINNIKIATPEEQLQVLNEFNNTKIDFSNEITVTNLLETQVYKNPNNIAIVHDNIKLTYLELNKKVNQLAKYLINHKIKNKIIAVYLPKSIEYVISILSILKSGNSFMPLSTSYPKDRIEYMINNSETPIIITKTDLLNTINSTTQTLEINNFKFDNFSNYNPNLKLDAKSLAYIIFTSGSTGLPKAVGVSHFSLVNHIFGIQNRFDGSINSSDIALSIANISFDANIQEIFIPLAYGAELHLLEDDSIFNPSYLANYIYKNKISFTFIPPTLLDILYNELSTYKKIYLNKMLVGVQSIHNTTLNNYFNLNPNIKIHNGYGPTEATICCISCMYNKRNEESNFILPIGKPMDNCEAYILDDSRKYSSSLCYWRTLHKWKLFI